MKRVYFHKENRTLSVGEVYEFYVVKCITIPDDEEYFVLQDPFYEKHLLPKKYYKNYGIQEKQYLQCHVDKVNCKGQIFLEPLHPIYLRGKYYQFKYIRAEKYLTKKGVEKQLYIFEGSDSSVAILEGKLIAPPENSAKRKYKVIKVKKSKVYLSE